MKLEKSLNMLDQIIEKAEYDSYNDSIEQGFKHESFYLFNLKVLIFENIFSVFVYL